MGAISMPQGRGNRQHNIRGYGEGKTPNNIDLNRTAENVIWKDETIGHAYHRIFDEALNEYNDKQKRADRKIQNYHQHIMNSKNGEKEFYEDVIQWGKQDDFKDNPELRNVAKICLLEYIEDFEERNPNLELIGAYIHMDEASPHMHFDFIPVAEGYKSGMQKRNSLDRAMKGNIKFRTGSDYSPRSGERNKAGKCTDNATKQWKELERAVFRDICTRHNLSVDMEVPTPERDSLSVLDYKKQQREIEVAKLDDLKEKISGEILTSAEVYHIDVSKPLFSQKVKIPYLEYVNLKATAQEIDTVKTSARNEIDAANERADTGIKEANARAEEGIRIANDRADTEIESANQRADEAIEDANYRAERAISRAEIKIEEAEDLKEQANDIIKEQNSILSRARKKAKSIIDEAIQGATEKAKEALNEIKSQITQMKNRKVDLQDEIQEEEKRLDQVIETKSKELDALIERRTSEANAVIANAEMEYDKIIHKAYEDAGVDSVMKELDEKLGIVSMKEVWDCKQQVLTSLEKAKPYLSKKQLKAVDENDVDVIKDAAINAIKCNPDGTVRKFEPGKDELFDLYRTMDEYQKALDSPRSKEEVMAEVMGSRKNYLKGRK